MRGVMYVASSGGYRDPMAYALNPMEVTSDVVLSALAQLNFEEASDAVDASLRRVCWGWFRPHFVRARRKVLLCIVQSKKQYLREVKVVKERGKPFCHRRRDFRLPAGQGGNTWQMICLFMLGSKAFAFRKWMSCLCLSPP